MSCEFACPKIAFLAYENCLNLLQSELSSRFSIFPDSYKIYGELILLDDDKFAGNEKFICDENRVLPYFACTVLYEPKIEKINSIGNAAKLLKTIQRNWALYQPLQSGFFRRATLIQEKLPYINTKPKKFPFEIPSSAIGFFTLLDENTLLYSSKTSSFLPLGRIEFIEDHENPPSRAYLKLQEALVRFNNFYEVSLPSSESRCFEAGACPGGWTWVLRQLNAKVFAVDRAPLADSLMSDSSVIFQAHDAFTLKPEQVCATFDSQRIDWVFSDVICYPERLYEWVNKWIESDRTKNMICTIKMQGEIDWSLVEKFASIKNSHIVHLCYNKHELTWMWRKI